MWRKFVDWYWEWEDEQIAVLEQPSLAANARTGLLRRHATQIAQLSLVERQQLLAFSLAFRRRTSVVLGTLALVSPLSVRCCMLFSRSWAGLKQSWSAMCWGSSWRSALSLHGSATGS